MPLMGVDPPRQLSMTLNIDGTLFQLHVLDDERGLVLRQQWLVYMIEAVLPNMNAATLFQVRVP